MPCNWIWPTQQITIIPFFSSASGHRASLPQQQNTLAAEKDPSLLPHWLLFTPWQELLQRDHKWGVPYSCLPQPMRVNIPLSSANRETTGKQLLIEMQIFWTFHRGLTQEKTTYFDLLKEMKTSPIHQSISVPSAFTPGILQSTMNTFFLYFTTNICKQLCFIFLE